jgi:hypothetical protein
MVLVLILGSLSVRLFKGFVVGITAVNVRFFNAVPRLTLWNLNTRLLFAVPSLTLLRGSLRLEPPLVLISFNFKFFFVIPFIPVPFVVTPFLTIFRLLDMSLMAVFLILTLHDSLDISLRPVAIFLPKAGASPA